MSMTQRGKDQPQPPKGPRNMMSSWGQGTHALKMNCWAADPQLLLSVASQNHRIN